VREIKWKRNGWAGHLGERRGAQMEWWRNLKERYPLEDQGVDERIILEWI